MRERASTIGVWLRRRFPALLALLLTLVTVLSVNSAPAKPLQEQVTPDARQYIDTAQNIVEGNGFVTNYDATIPNPPRYAPGYPLALAPFAKLQEFPEGQQLGQRVIVILYVLAVVGAAWALAGANAGSFAALILLLTPFARASVPHVMSDLFGAFVPLLVVPLLVFRTDAGDRLSGALLGFAATVRLTAGVGLIAALIAVHDRRARIRLILWAAPFIVALHALQYAMFGNPFFTGYDNGNAGFSEMFALRNIVDTPAAEGLWMIPEPFPNAWIDQLAPAGAAPATGLSNLFFYPAVMLGLVWIYLPPFIGVVGIVYAWRHRHEAAVQYAVLSAVGTIVVYWFYGYQAARMIAISGTMLVVLTAAGLARSVDWMGRVERLWSAGALAAGDRAGSESEHGRPSGDDGTERDDDATRDSEDEGELVPA